MYSAKQTACDRCRRLFLRVEQNGTERVEEQGKWE